MIAEILEEIGYGGGRVVLSGNGGPRSAAALVADTQTLAAWLRHRSARVLAVLADNGVTWVNGDLAARAAGVVHLPLPGFFSNAQLSHALNAGGADLMLTDQPARVLALGLGFHHAGQWDGYALLRRELEPVPLPAGTAKISFTSGSTGTPKGVCLSAAGLLETARAVDAALADVPIRRHLAVLPLALLLENVAGLYAPLLRGAEVILPGLDKLGWRGMAGFDALALSEQVEAERPDSLILVPELLKAWTLALEKAALRAPECLRFVAVGGARVDPALLERARRVGLPAYEGYGLTECGSVVTLNLPGADRIGSVGRPLPHVTLEAAEEAGEIRVSNRVFLGYLGEGWRVPESWPTGDIGFLDEAGHLRLSGRRRHLIVTAYGRNVAPEWVEAALTAQPEIAQAMAVGEARPWLAALLVPAPGAGPDQITRAVASANALLPDYARVRNWSAVPPFTPADGLATGNGRLVRAAIAARHVETIGTLYPDTETSHVL